MRDSIHWMRRFDTIDSSLYELLDEHDRLIDENLRLKTQLSWDKTRLSEAVEMLRRHLFKRS